MLKKLTPAEAAYIMGCSPQFVRVGLQRGVLNIGEAVNISGGNRWTYNISPAKVAERQGLTMEEVEREVNEFEKEFAQKFA